MHTRSAYRLATAAVACLVLTAAPRAQEVPLAEVSHIHGIGFDPESPGAVLLATHYGVFRATPNGKASAISADTSDYMGFSVDPSGSGRLLASGHPGQGGGLGVIASTDGGVNWTKLSDGANGPVDFHAMTISRTDPNVIYGLQGGIQVSRDGGENWTVAGPGPERVIDLSVAPTTADTVYAGAVAGLMRSTDAGASWASVGPSGRAATMVEATADGSLYVFFAGSGLYRLPADGKWEALASSFGERYLLHLATDPGTPGHLVAVTDESAVLESTDGGKTWAPFGK